MRPCLVFVAACALLCLASPQTRAADPSPAELLEQAQEASAAGESEKAVSLLSQAIKANPQLAEAWYARGREHFRLAKIAESVADFDEYVRLRPQRSSSLWERGISLYYAEKFEQGAKQFAQYQTFDNNDVENAVWRFLCVAREHGVERARKDLLPIERDPRVPMMQVYELYRGQATPDDVLAAANRAAPSDAAQKAQLFYAHLYLGLYQEALGNEAQAKEHLTKAAKEYRIGHYMGDVARVHVRLRWEK